MLMPAPLITSSLGCWSSIVCSALMLSWNAFMGAL
jgi:hypothetical protein